MPDYMATPHSQAGAVVDLAPATGLKTILQVGIPAGVLIKVLGWGVSIAGVAAADVPFYAYLMEGDVAASVGTSLTPDQLDPPGGATGPFGFQMPSLCVGGAALTMYNAAPTEGTITNSRFIDSERVHPQSGYSVWFPDSARPLCGAVAAARFLRLRVNAVTTAYNLIPWIAWRE